MATVIIIEDMSKKEILKRLGIEGRVEEFKTTTKERTKEVLKKLKLNSSYAGYQCIVETIELVKDKKDFLLSRDVIPKVAEILGTTKTSVRRNIQTATKIIFDRATEKTRYEVFMSKDYVAPKELISAIRDIVMRYK